MTSLAWLQTGLVSILEFSFHITHTQHVILNTATPQQEKSVWCLSLLTISICPYLPRFLIFFHRLIQSVKVLHDSFHFFPKRQKRLWVESKMSIYCTVCTGNARCLQTAAVLWAEISGEGLGTHSDVGSCTRNNNSHTLSSAVNWQCRLSAALIIHWAKIYYGQWHRRRNS